MIYIIITIIYFEAVAMSLARRGAGDALAGRLATVPRPLLPQS